MPGDVTSLMAALWARHDVVRVDNTFTFVQIREEEDRRLAIFAGHDDVPRPLLRDDQRGTAFLSGTETLVQTVKPGAPSQFSAKTDFQSFPACVSKVYLAGLYGREHPVSSLMRYFEN